VVARRAGPERPRRRLARAGRTALLYATVGGVCLAIVFPVYWMVLSVIQPSRHTMRFPPPFWPREVSLTPFAELFGELPILGWILNSTLLAALSTALVLALAVLGAYALSAPRWRGRGGFAFFLLVTQMLPEALIVIPIFAIYRRVGLRESLPGLALIDAAFVLPIGVWILKGLFDRIPREIFDAALVDGCGRLATLRRIVLPLSVPGLVAVGVVAFFQAWNEFLFASTMVTRPEIRPASVGLASLISMLDTPIERVLAAGLVFSIGPVVFYLAMQRYIVAGLTAGAVKG
jgi:multiple sugar transport system permease protein